MKGLRKNKKGIIVVLGLSFFIFLGVNLFQTKPKTQSIKTEGNGTSVVTEPVFKKEGTLHFFSINNDTLVRIDIEIADDEYETTRGLMYRKSMGAKQGMLFIFPFDDYRSFWMQNTHISLDIIYADSEGVIGSVQENTIPYSEATLPSDKPAKYVIEVNAGFYKMHNLSKGCKVVFNREEENV
jgi:uncharacterized membrane protein (UPF0127 family)